MKKMNLLKSCAVIFLTFIFYAGHAQSTPNPVAWWNFDSVQARGLADQVSNIQDSVHGNFSLTAGTYGKALKLDGFSTSVTRKSGLVPQLGNSFTMEAWIAPATYPWNWVPILAQGENGKTGFYFGVGPQGQTGISASVNGVWQSCESEAKLAFKEDRKSVV